ncbi:CbiQ family ECF transporter T component [Thalassiella azotivora]
MLTGLYVPGRSPLHRAAAGAKLTALVVFSTLLVAFRSPAGVLVATAVVVTATVVARLPARTLVAQVWPLRWVVLLLVPFQLWTAGWRTAVAVVGTLVVAVAAASVVTLTTRVSEMMGALTRALRPLRPLGVDPERVALVLSLTVRAIPVVAGAFAEAREARRARGLDRSTRALVTPVVVRTVRHADRVGEALAARGLDD